LIFVTTGSRAYPFDRLCVKLDELIEKGVIREELFAQIGVSSYVPKHYAYCDYLSPEEFEQRVGSADIVITHGASGSIMKALNMGKKVIAVTRLEKYGEISSDHQAQYSEAFSSNKYVLAAFEMDDLEDKLLSIYDGNADLVPWENKDPLAIVRMIDEFIQENWDD